MNKETGEIGSLENFQEAYGKDVVVPMTDEQVEKLKPMHLKDRLQSLEKAMQKPSVGRMVHYQRYGSPGGEHKAEPSPAVIVKINDEDSQRCQLFVMNPNGVYFNDTPYSEEPKPGHWSWPPRV